MAGAMLVVGFVDWFVPRLQRITPRVFDGLLTACVNIYRQMCFLGLPRTALFIVRELKR